MFDRIVTQLNTVDLRAMSLDGLHGAAAGVKRVRAALDALEARLLTVAADRTFDPAAGLEMLRAGGGCSQREARRKLRRAEALDEMPKVADALAEGDITAEHADALAQAARSTSPEAVDGDAALLEKTKDLPADLAAREVTDWTSRRQSIEDREAKFRRQRAMRSHRTWNDSEGMVNFRTRLDPVTGAQARAVIDDIADRLHRADGGRDAKPGQTRTWDQRNADALAAALGINPIPGGGPGVVSGAGTSSQPSADPPGTGPVPGGEPGTGSRPATKLPSTNPVPNANLGGGPGTDQHPTAEPSSTNPIPVANPGGGPGTDRHPPAKSLGESPGCGAGGPGPGVARGPASAPPPAPTAPVTGPAGRDEQQPHVTGPAVGNRPGPSLRNQILVIAHTDAITGADPDARCEIPGTGPIPRSELERLACEAELFGALFSRNGLPLWHGRRTRTVTPQQWRTLIARDRGCVLCAAEPSHCHAHHIIPWTAPAKGPTDIDNLVLVCNRHHHHIHQHHLTLTREPNGQWATHTPNSRASASLTQPRAARPARKPPDRSDQGRGDSAAPDPASHNSHAQNTKQPAAIRAGP